MYDPGPRSITYKQTWLHTAYPCLATIPLSISNALVTIHRYKQSSKSSFNLSKTLPLTSHNRHLHPAVLGVVTGTFCTGVFISTSNLVFTCCSMAFFISIALLHLVASIVVVLPLVLCSDHSPFARRDFKLVPASLPPSVKQFLPRVSSKSEDRQKLSQSTRKTRIRTSKTNVTNNNLSDDTSKVSQTQRKVSDKTVLSSLL